MEETFFDTPLLREPAQLEEFARLPDESTILRFRHRLGKHKLEKQIMATVKALLTERGLLYTVRGSADHVNGVAAEGNALLHGQERVDFGNVGYQSIEKRHALHNKDNEADAMLDEARKLQAGIRVKVEHSFLVVKRQFDFVNVRYRGLMKNTAQLFTLFVLSNLWMVRSKLIGVGV